VVRRAAFVVVTDFGVSVYVTPKDIGLTLEDLAAAPTSGQ
jgi:hypothetical protein